MKLLNTLAVVGTLSMLSAQSMALDASSLKVKVYAVMISTSPLCTNPITIFSNTSPTEVNFLSAPSIGGGNPPDGTYNCVIVKMSDNIKFVPASSSGSCSASVENTMDICRLDNSGSSGAPDSGTTTACTGTSTSASPDIVYMYLTTNASAGAGNSFLQPDTTSSTRGINLATPLVISGSAKSKFIVNTTGKVDGSQPACGMNAPVFSFLKL